MYRWFESLLNPFPPEEPVEPPRTLVAFCLHYTRGSWPLIVVYPASSYGTGRD